MSNLGERTCSGVQPTAAPAASSWPTDAVLLPVRHGQLLVSREHARFCRVPGASVTAVEEVLRGKRSWESCDPTLVDELRRHGFGGEPSRPQPMQRTVLIQLTNGCNLECSFCSTNSRRHPPRHAPCEVGRRRELTYASALAAVRDTREVFGAGARIGIIGGEPLLVPWAIDLAERVLDSGLELHISSNGTALVDEAVARRMASLVQRGALVRLSLAGATRERCDEESRGPRFEATIAGIHAMARWGALPVVDVMLFPDDTELVARQLPELRRMLPEGIQMTLGLIYVSGREQGGHVFRSRWELEAALDRIALEAGETIPGVGTSPTTPRREGCGCTQGTSLHIRSDGQLYTCFKMEEPVGRLDGEGGFAEQLRRLPSSVVSASSYATCTECPLATLCGGGCRAENVRYTACGSTPPCGPWRVRVLCELLAEDRPEVLTWPVEHLLAEARARDIPAPARLTPRAISRSLTDVP